MITPSPRVLAFAAGGPQSLFSRLFGVPWYSQMLRDWIGGLELADASRIVEVGTAGGDLAGYLAGAGHDATGVDLSAGAVRAAARRHPQASFVRANALDLPFGDGSAAAVVGASLINLVPDRVAAFGEFGRVAAGGVVSVLFPAAGFDDVACDELSRRLGLQGFDAAALRTWHSMAAKCDAREVAADARKAGLSGVRSALVLDGFVATMTGDAR